MRQDDSAILIAIQDQSYERAGSGIRDSYPKKHAKDEVRLAEFLEGQRYAVLATSRPHGRPQAASVAYTIWNAAFWIASVGGARVRNLRAGSHASIVVMEGEGPSHRAVIAEGPVILHDAAEFERFPREFGDLWVARHGEVPT
jgi:hypothetical protein